MSSPTDLRQTITGTIIDVLTDSALPAVEYLKSKLCIRPTML
jgi:hypothetical protein